MPAQYRYSEPEEIEEYNPEKRTYLFIGSFFSFGITADMSTREKDSRVRNYSIPTTTGQWPPA